MPEANSYAFKHKEVLELLIKKADVHEGKWMLMANFGFSGGNVGPSPEEASPGAFVAILNIGIQRAGADSPSGLMLDAADVNPAKPST
jgi:hypothetical protein